MWLPTPEKHCFTATLWAIHQFKLGLCYKWSNPVITIHTNHKINSVHFNFSFHYIPSVPRGKTKQHKWCFNNAVSNWDFPCVELISQSSRYMYVDVTETERQLAGLNRNSKTTHTQSRLPFLCVFFQFYKLLRNRDTQSNLKSRSRRVNAPFSLSASPSHVTEYNFSGV